MHEEVEDDEQLVNSEVLSKLSKKMKKSASAKSTRIVFFFMLQKNKN